MNADVQRCGRLQTGRAQHADSIMDNNAFSLCLKRTKWRITPHLFLTLKDKMSIKTTSISLKV